MQCSQRRQTTGTIQKDNTNRQTNLQMNNIDNEPTDGQPAMVAAHVICTVFLHVSVCVYVCVCACILLTYNLSSH